MDAQSKIARYLLCFLCLLLSSGCTVIEQKYLPELQAAGDSIHIPFISIWGYRPQDDSKIQETSPYHFYGYFTTRSKETDAEILLKKISIPEIGYSWKADKRLKFKEPSTNPHNKGIRFSDAIRSPDFEIDFDKVSQFDVILEYEIEVPSGRKTSFNEKVLFKRKLQKINVIIYTLMRI